MIWKIKNIIYRITKKCFIGKNAVVINCEFEEQVNFAHDCEVLKSSIGKKTSIGRYSKVNNAVIGRYCSISWDVSIGAKSHPLYRISTHSFPYRKMFNIVNKDLEYDDKKTIIGNDVWIGCNAVIMSGVTIGDGAIIGASAVVTKDVEPYSVVVGIPAKSIKKRFDDNVIDELQKIEWWNYTDEELKNNIEYFDQNVNLDLLRQLKRED